ncbi:MAG TPA: tetratricopeptide repeat protein [Ktedonobacterales bacterium]
MEYLDFDVELTALTGRDYRAAVRSPAGKANAIMRFPFDETLLENHLLKLQNALLRSGEERRRALTPEEQAVRGFGRQLFEALIAGDVRACYDQSRVRANQEGKGLRLRLDAQVPELAALPWELLYDPTESEYICLSRATPIVRYLNLPGAREALLVTPPLRILGVVASPNSPATPALDVASEQARLERALSSLKARELIELVWLEGQTWRALQQAMWVGPWHILHFIGHGGFNERAEEGMLALASEKGALDLLSATQLGRVLADHPSLRLVVLNACEGARAGKGDIFSSVGASLARRGIPAVLAMQYEITDHAAIELTRTFYEALAHGLPVDAAVTEARIAINVGSNNSLEWGTPVLFLSATDGALFHLPPPAPEKMLGQWLEEGIAHRKARRYSLALEAYEQALRLAPNAAAAVFGKGNALWELKRQDEARAIYESAFQLPANNAAAHPQKGIALYNLKRYEEALAAFERALQLDSSDPLASNGKGIALVGLKRYEEALAAFERAMQLDPHLALAYSNKGIALQSLQRYEEALAAFERALQLDPTFPNGYFGKGMVLNNLKRYDEALAALERATQLDFHHAQLDFQKGFALSNLKRHAAALAAYERAIELDPNLAGAYTNKGWMLVELQRYQEALPVLERAIQLNPNSAPTYNNKGGALRSLQRYQEALAAYDRALQLDPTDALPSRNKGNLLSDLQRYDEALAAYDHALQCDPANALAYSGKGYALKQLRRYQEALAASDYAIQLNPNLANPYFNRGYALSQLQRHQESLTSYQRCIQLDPNNVDAYNNIGWALYNLQRYQEALPAYDYAIQLNPTYALPYYNKGLLFQKLGRKREANKAFQKARELGYHG